MRLGAHRRVSRLPAATAADSRDTSSKAPRFIRRRRRFGAFLVARSKKKTPSDRMGYSFWIGRRGSNSLPRPWQGRALPDELRPQTAPLLRHLGASGRSRTNDTRIFSPLLYLLSYRGMLRRDKLASPHIMATRNRLELSTSSVTGWRANRLHHRAICWWKVQGSNL